MKFFDVLAFLQQANISAYEVVTFYSHYYLARVGGGDGARAKGTSLAGIPLRCEFQECSTFARSRWELGGTGPFLCFKVSSLAKASGTRVWDLRIRPPGFQMGLTFFVPSVSWSQHSSVQTYLAFIHRVPINYVSKCQVNKSRNPHGFWTSDLTLAKSVPNMSQGCMHQHGQSAYSVL